MIFIGTAGWSLPHASARYFPGHGSHLQRYAQRLNCAEINSSFYRSHARTTYERWAGAVPATFRFAVKIPKAITHDAKLKRVRVPLRKFLDEIKGLGRSLGPLLMQLPPSFVFDAKVARRFYLLLRDWHRGPVVIEPRHISWFATDSKCLLAKYRISQVTADPALTADLTVPNLGRGTLHYSRLHGSPRTYWSNYSFPYLRELAKRVEGMKSTVTVWIIFDNTAAGCATANALQLQTLLKTTVPRRTRVVLPERALL